VLLAWVCRLRGSEAVAALAAAVIAAAAVLTLHVCNREVHISMHWDRRFAIVVSLIWAVLVSGAFYLVAGMLPPASNVPASDGQLRRELDRTNHILTTPVAMSGCARVRISP
jgi:hypothetical protein